MWLVTLASLHTAWCPWHSGTSRPCSQSLMTRPSLDWNYQGVRHNFICQIVTCGSCAQGEIFVYIIFWTLSLLWDRQTRQTILFNVYVQDHAHCPDFYPRLYRFFFSPISPLLHKLTLFPLVIVTPLSPDITPRIQGLVRAWADSVNALESAEL